MNIHHGEQSLMPRVADVNDDGTRKHAENKQTEVSDSVESNLALLNLVVVRGKQQVSSIKDNKSSSLEQQVSSIKDNKPSSLETESCHSGASLGHHQLSLRDTARFHQNQDHEQESLDDELATSSRSNSVHTVLSSSTSTFLAAFDIGLLDFDDESTNLEDSDPSFYSSPTLSTTAAEDVSFVCSGGCQTKSVRFRETVQIREHDVTVGEPIDWNGEASCPLTLDWPFNVSSAKLQSGERPASGSSSSAPRRLTLTERRQQVLAVQGWSDAQLEAIECAQLLKQASEALSAFRTPKPQGDSC